MTSASLSERLRTLLLERSVRRGNFILASGRQSSFYIDARLTTMSGEGLIVIGDLALVHLASRAWKPAAVGGLTLGADPVAYAIAAAAHRTGVTIDAFTVRKQAKQHGTGKRIEGCFAAGDFKGQTIVLYFYPKDDTPVAPPKPAPCATDGVASRRKPPSSESAWTR